MRAVRILGALVFAPVASVVLGVGWLVVGLVYMGVITAPLWLLAWWAGWL